MNRIVEIKWRFEQDYFQVYFSSAIDMSKVIAKTVILSKLIRTERNAR
jgi:hypothetical protein